MKNEKMLKVKILKVIESSHNPSGYFNGEPFYNEHSYIVYEYENGLIQVPSSTNYDWFFENREEIIPTGINYIVNIVDLEETVTVSAKDLLQAIQNSIKFYELEFIPQKHLELWKPKKKTLSDSGK